MVAASLLLLQILSETYTPKEKDQCVGVTYKGVAYKAKKASRSRFTGRVLLTMRDEAPSYTPLAGSSACMEKCISSNRPATPSPQQRGPDEEFYRRIAEQTVSQFCAEKCAAA